MNKYEKAIIFILLKICRILSKNTNSFTGTYLFDIEQKLKQLNMIENDRK